MSVAKFRPLLSEDDVRLLLHGLSLLGESAQISATTRKLRTFQLKVENGINSASYTTNAGTPKKSQFEKVASEEEIAAYFEAEMSKKFGSDSDDAAAGEVLI